MDRTERFRDALSKLLSDYQDVDAGEVLSELEMQVDALRYSTRDDEA